MSEVDFTNQTINQYHLIERLQKRPLTTLYTGRDTNKSDRPVFIELLNQPAAVDEALAGRFQRRLETVQQLEHPHIAPILQIGRAPLTAAGVKQGNTPNQDPAKQYVYAVIEHLPGLTLAAQMEKWRSSDNWPDIPYRISLVHGLASALTAIHPVGIFHHDLRPQNLIMGDNGRLTFIDLGVPIAPTPPIEPPDPNNPPDYLDYASPEQLAGKPLSGPSNIYSLGIILYELLATHQPVLPVSEWDIFERSELPREIPLYDVRQDLTRETYAVVKNCLCRQDWNRYETAANLVTDLAAAKLAEEERINPTPSRNIFRSVGAIFKRGREEV